MSSKSKIQLKTSSVLSVPLQTYQSDFSFIVNGTEIKTSRLISDLLSPTISKIHSNEPTFDVFEINTKERGDFSTFIKLTNFKETLISEDEIPFILEVLEILGNDNIDIEEHSQMTPITKDNVFSQLKKHEKYQKIYFKQFKTEIDFISAHFFELCEERTDDFTNLKIDTLQSILNNAKLQLNTEDQLLKFVNKLYSRNSEYFELYEHVYFENVSTKLIGEFIGMYDYNDLTFGTWQRLAQRLREEIKNSETEKKQQKRYKEKPQRGMKFSKTEGNDFNGILNYLRTKSNGQIEKEVDITSSDNKGNPQNVVVYEDTKKYFNHRNSSENWICFDFKEHRIIPTDYTIRSIHYGPGWDHPKDWDIECSVDKNSWDPVDEVKNCSYLNGKSLVHTFNIKKQLTKEYRYLRMRATGKSWDNDDYLSFESFEIYGTLI